MNPRPIEIIGGGLAGLSLGIALRRGGVPVTLHEAGDYPRHRVCGEFISGLSPTTIDRLALGDTLHDALRNETIAWSIGKREPQLQRLPSPALGLSRHVLDARLARSFVALGGELRTRSRVTDDTDQPGRIYATGRRRAAQPHWIGLKIHLRAFPLTQDLEMHLGEQSYIGLARVAPDTVNVCGLFRRRDVAQPGPALLINYVRSAGLDALADRLAAGTCVPDSFCAVAALDFDQRVHLTNHICLGDTGAMIPPFTGNGMAMAFQSAEIALAPLLAYTRGDIAWTETRCIIARALRDRFRVRLASADWLHPFLLRPRRQQWFATLSRARLLPFRPLYATLH